MIKVTGSSGLSKEITSLKEEKKVIDKLPGKTADLPQV